MEPNARHVLPEFTERTHWGVRSLDPYSKLLEGRIILLGTPVDATAAGDVVAQLVHLEYAAPDQDVSLYINSPGGPVDAMTAIYDAMQTIACDVATTCVGQAASTAAVLLAAGAPGKRSALPGARVLLRQPELAEPLRGRPSDLDVHARELTRQHDLLLDLLARHTGRERDRVAADLDRDLVLDAAGAREHGLVDHVVRSRKA
ncbi:ATP-dependent Clp protease proteolytic subunit [Streptomyces sudanensis]|uniref:ATP-dependent Clp protease proteolytic subunit n=1 Tax=Streptomyces sudanensis TaxID=436397 RepID=UPI0020CEF91F|nr:ATP-dependent Clp protease proteolytic subunit [Streptomyces sudanensis]MCP9959861.1 ATP-dependent Clp protease proteolytic subunit [Streptomyces sudanensis]MCP9988891.1 ATP-dependent Clp protease proteolytic subunit [Streptomyces sudanensis]MCP9999733.1 ATP-dependent Clp protease proteolytic subunit [Streptomyces sudanensis]